MKKLYITALILGLIALGAVTYTKLSDGAVGGSTTIDTPSSENRIVNYTFFNATTTTATSTNVPVTFTNGVRDDGSVSLLGAKKATVYFGRGDTTGQGNTGASVFTVQGTPDGSTWYAINRLIEDDVSGTATSTHTITAATSTNAFSIDLTFHAWKSLRCLVTEVTDGEHTCSTTIEY